MWIFAVGRLRVCPRPSPWTTCAGHGIIPADVGGRRGDVPGGNGSPDARRGNNSRLVFQRRDDLNGITQFPADFRQPGGIAFPAAPQGGVIADQKPAQPQAAREPLHEVHGSLVSQCPVEGLGNDHIHAA